MSDHYRRGDPETGCAMLAGFIGVTALILWFLAFSGGWWPFLLGFTVISFAALWWYSRRLR